MALITLAQLKARLGISDASKDDDLTAIIAGVTSQFRTYLGWDKTVFTDVIDAADPSAVEVTEYASPNGGPTLVLKLAPPDCPVTVTDLREDSSREFAADTELTIDEDFIQEKTGGSALRRLGTDWPFDRRKATDRLAAGLYQEIGTVKAVYDIDAEDAVSAMKRAAAFECMAQANATYSAFGLGVVTSDGMDGASVTVSPNAKGGNRPADGAADGFVSPLTAGILRPYRFPLIG